MDLLHNIATELGFEFHLYIVKDELFGSKFHKTKKKYGEDSKKEYDKKFNNLDGKYSRTHILTHSHILDRLSKVRPSSLAQSVM